MKLTEDNVKEICSELLGAEIENIDFPGGKSRESVRASFQGHGIIITHRKNLERARLESVVLKSLNQNNAPVPRLIAAKDNWLIQQDVGARRLSEALRGATEAEASALIESALASLKSIHELGKQNELLKTVVVIGQKEKWLEHFVNITQRLAESIEIPAPEIDKKRIINLLRVEKPTFIKWDARPGNAMVRNDKVVWIDWEHCGRRHPLDDMAWLLADEFTPYLEESESALLSKVIAAFAHGLSADQAHEYLSVYGVLHSCIRLELILRYREKENEWWDYDYCMRFDKIGVVQELANRVASRALQWSEKSLLTKKLSPWFNQIQVKLNQL